MKSASLKPINADMVLDALPMLLLVFNEMQTLVSIHGKLVFDFKLDTADMIGSKIQDARRQLPITISHLKMAYQGTEFTANLEYRGRILEVNYIPLFDGKNVTSVICMCHDVTKRMEVERDLVERQTRVAFASRLVAISEMAGGIAHEINNPLTIILGNCAVARRFLERPEIPAAECSKILGKIETTAHRINKIVMGLLTIGQTGDRDEFLEVDLPEILQGIVDLSREKAAVRDTMISCLPHIGERLGMIRVTEVSQAIISLLSNALDAVQNLADRWVRVESSIVDGMITISVADSGPGIPPEISARMFDSFFTTKPVHQGSGIGLSMVKSVMDRHQGKITLDDRAKHTKFIMEFPQHRRDT